MAVQPQRASLLMEPVIACTTSHHSHFTSLVNLVNLGSPFATSSAWKALAASSCVGPCTFPAGGCVLSGKSYLNWTWFNFWQVHQLYNFSRWYLSLCFSSPRLLLHGCLLSLSVGFTSFFFCPLQMHKLPHLAWRGCHLWVRAGEDRSHQKPYREPKQKWANPSSKATSSCNPGHHWSGEPWAKDHPSPSSASGFQDWFPAQPDSPSRPSHHQQVLSELGPTVSQLFKCRHLAHLAAHDAWSDLIKSMLLALLWPATIQVPRPSFEGRLGRLGTRAPNGSTKIWTSKGSTVLNWHVRCQ